MNNTNAESKTTVDHDTIRSWVERRDGRPAVVEATTEGKGEGILRIDFGDKDPDLQEISWNYFFEVFEENNLAFLYQEQTSGGEESRFFKLIERE